MTIFCGNIVFLSVESTVSEDLLKAFPFWLVEVEIEDRLRFRDPVTDFIMVRQQSYLSPQNIVLRWVLRNELCCKFAGVYAASSIDAGQVEI